MSDSKSIRYGSDDSVDANEFASILGINRRTFNRFRAEGKLPNPIRVKGQLYWTRPVVNKHVEEETLAGRYKDGKLVCGGRKRGKRRFIQVNSFPEVVKKEIAPVVTLPEVVEVPLPKQAEAPLSEQASEFVDPRHKVDDEIKELTQKLEDAKKKRDQISIHHIGQRFRVKTNKGVVMALLGEKEVIGTVAKVGFSDLTTGRALGQLKMFINSVDKITSLDIDTMVGEGMWSLITE